jgi:hypothetical protein
MHGKSQPDKLGQYGGAAGPCLDYFFLSRRIHLVDFFREMVVNERAFLD